MKNTPENRTNEKETNTTRSQTNKEEMYSVDLMFRGGPVERKQANGGTNNRFTTLLLHMKCHGSELRSKGIHLPLTTAESSETSQKQRKLYHGERQTDGQTTLVCGRNKRRNSFFSIS